jgi:superfamily II DNA or RNA helicase
VANVELRDYQKKIIDDARAAMKRSRRVLLQAPTGAGKTALASFMAGETSRRGSVVWFVCHRAELVAQTSFTFRKFGIDHGFIASGYPYDQRHSVFICSIDTVKNRLGIVAPPRLIIFDECHHLGAAGWTRVQAAFPDAWNIGLSATPQRLDGKGLRANFDEIVLGPTVSWLTINGHLSPYRAYAPSAPDMSGVKRSMGDYSKSEAEKRADTPTLTGDAIAHWRKHAPGLRSVAFGVTVAHSQHIAEQFKAAGIPAAHLDGSTPKFERSRIIRDFASGELVVLSNVDLFGEGFDLSAIAQREVTIDCVLQMRPTQSLALHLQQVGRALRPSPGKTAIILDHAGNMHRHGLPDEDRDWSLEGRDMKKKAANDNGPPPPITCEGCFGQIRRPAPPECPYCGKRLAPTTREITVGDGELKEITEREKIEIRNRRIREQAEAETMNDLVALGEARGYSNPKGWAYRVFNNRKRRA